MRQQTLLFDLDDTLIHCNKYFIEVINYFSAQLIRWFDEFRLTKGEIKEKQLEIDLEFVHKHGFTSMHFPQSFVDTYKFYAAKFGLQVEKHKIDELISLGRSVYEKEIETYPHMNETLVRLRGEGHHLCLYTGGDPLIQQKKIEQIGLREFFHDRIFIARHKNTKSLDEIIRENSFERGHTWMIGNSIRTDIVPALECGIHAIHIPAEKEWQYNIIQVNVEAAGAFFKLNALNDVPPAIYRYLQTS